MIWMVKWSRKKWKSERCKRKKEKHVRVLVVREACGIRRIDQVNCRRRLSHERCNLLCWKWQEKNRRPPPSKSLFRIISISLPVRLSISILSSLLTAVYFVSRGARIKITMRGGGGVGEDDNEMKWEMVMRGGWKLRSWWLETTPETINYGQNEGERKREDETESTSRESWSSFWKQSSTIKAVLDDRHHSSLTSDCRWRKEV